MLKIFHHPLPKGYSLLDFIIHSPSFHYTLLHECDFILHNHIIWGEEKRGIQKKIFDIDKSYPSTKPVLVFVVADYDGRYILPNRIILLRTSLKKSSRGINELPLPYLWSFYEAPFETITSVSTPSVGFCGLLSKPRKKLVGTFQKSPDIHADFICRKKFWGGSPHDQTLIQEFDKNIKSNIFVLAPRGKGNFSMRFYQVLSAGRVPVLVDTDLELPFEDQIPWDEKIILGKNEKECEKKVLDTFYNDTYISLQSECRKIYDSFFSLENYFNRLAPVLKAKYL